MTTYAVILIACLVVFAYLCRLDALHVAEHKLGFVILHVALAGSAASTGVHAWQQTLDLQDFTGLIAAALWIGVSFKDWRAGVPAYVQSRPAPLEPLDWPDIKGGRKD